MAWTLFLLHGQGTAPSWSCSLCGVLAPRLLFVYREGSRCTSPCCLMLFLCQSHSFLGLDSQPEISDPCSRVTAFSPVSWWWLCYVLLGSEMIPAALYFCTKPCKGLLEESFQAPWPILLLSLRVGFPLAAFELIVTSRRPGLGSVWFLCGQSEEVMFPPADSQGSGLALWWLEWRMNLIAAAVSVKNQC